MCRPWATIPTVLLLAGGATTASSTAPALPVGRWFEQLADVDPAVRSAAFDHLIAMPADPGLPSLLAAVRDHLPVRPAQAAVLSEIVTQVFLADQPYDPNPGVWIMGQTWPNGIGGSPDRPGVPVVNCWPGFPARRLFRDGDLIFGLYSDPNAPPGQPPDLPTHDSAELIQAMRAYATPERVTMSVLRDGRAIRVAGAMVVEPIQTHDRHAADTAAFLLDRQRKADDYWRATFGPWVDPPAGRLVEPLDGPGR